MIVKRGMIRALLVPVVVLGMLFSSSVANADTGGDTKQQGMTLTGFDEAVARAHGYKIVTYANGDQQSVPVDPRSNLPKSQILHPTDTREADASHRTDARQVAAANTDYNSVQGNCGVSWIRVTQTGTNKVSVASGFRNVPYTAVDWSWDVSLSDRNGTSHQTAGGVMFGTAASRIWQNLNQYGWTYDYVYAGVAILINGSICTSGRPDVSINL